MQDQLLKANDLDLNKILFSPACHTKLFEYLSQSTESLPKIQPFCSELIEYLVTHQPQIAKELWHSLIDSKLCLRREPEKKYLSYKLFLIYLSLVTKSNYQVIFEDCLLKSAHVLPTLVHNYLNRKSNLNQVCKELVRELVDVVRVKEAEFLGSEL